jgi:hypothetical protein
MVRPMRHALLLLSLFVLACALTVNHAVGASLAPDGHCGQGDAIAIQNAFFPLVQNGPEGLDAFGLCQFRTYFEPDNGICFCEYDDIVAAGVWFESVASPDFPGCSAGDEDCSTPYDGWSARESVSLVRDTITLIQPTGLSIEAFTTPVKGGLHPIFGPVIWKQAGVVFRDLPPGSYTIRTETDHPAEAIFGPFEPSVVTFHVLPHDQAHELGRPTSGFEGSVRCPDDID